MKSSNTAKKFKALGGKERLLIVSFLADGEKCVCKITKRLGVPQNLASYHLKALERAGLVVSRKNGKWVHYSLNKEGLNEIIGFLQKVLPEEKGRRN